MFAGIEAGGTRFVCAVGTGPDHVVDESCFPTTTPSETLARVVSFFRTHRARGRLRALGVASFGPLDLAPGSPTYGSITTTPKPGWSGTDVAGALGRALDLPVGLDTDVNAAVLAEHRWGAARGLGVAVYLSVGTGIGGGVLVNGAVLHGLTHPEMGHVFVPHDRGADPFPGVCPFHGDCLEGLASGVALERRVGVRPEELPPDHPVWDLEARYLSLALVNQIRTLSPERIVVGGGVMKQVRLYGLVRRGLAERLGGYAGIPERAGGLERYVVPPALGSRAGVLGAIALAESVYRGRGGR